MRLPSWGRLQEQYLNDALQLEPPVAVGAQVPEEAPADLVTQLVVAVAAAVGLPEAGMHFLVAVEPVELAQAPEAGVPVVAVPS